MKGGRCRDDLTSQPGPPRVGAFFQAEPKAGISGGLAPALFQLSVLILGENYILLRAGPSSALVRPYFLCEVCVCVCVCVCVSSYGHGSLLVTCTPTGVCLCVPVVGFPWAVYNMCPYWGNAALTSFFF